MTEHAVTLPTSDGSMIVHGFVPENGAGGRLPAVIVLQEAFGVNDHIKRVCRRVADAGYAAFAPELFHRAGAGLTFGYESFAAAKPVLGALTNEQILEDLTVTRAHVGSLPFVDDARVAAWGFCMGGWASVLAACELPLAAALSFYGGGLVHPRPGIAFTPIVDRLGKARCPLLLVFGALDPSIPPSDIAAIREGLSGSSSNFEIEIYPEGGHGFFCEDRSAYHRPSAEAAWSRATRWLAEKTA
jgi:carboxymethylenebutenolidase